MLCRQKFSHRNWRSDITSREHMIWARSPSSICCPTPYPSRFTSLDNRLRPVSVPGTHSAVQLAPLKMEIKTIVSSSVVSGLGFKRKMESLQALAGWVGKAPRSRSNQVRAGLMGRGWHQAKAAGGGCQLAGSIRATSMWAQNSRSHVSRILLSSHTTTWCALQPTSDTGRLIVLSRLILPTVSSRLRLAFIPNTHSGIQAAPLQLEIERIGSLTVIWI